MSATFFIQRLQTFFFNFLHDFFLHFSRFFHLNVYYIYAARKRPIASAIFEKKVFAFITSNGEFLLTNITGNP